MISYVNGGGCLTGTKKRGEGSTIPYCVQLLWLNRVIVAEGNHPDTIIGEYSMAFRAKEMKSISVKEKQFKKSIQSQYESSSKCSIIMMSPLATAVSTNDTLGDDDS